jgi:antitoxin PrlF
VRVQGGASVGISALCANRALRCKVSDEFTIPSSRAVIATVMKRRGGRRLGSTRLQQRGRCGFIRSARTNWHVATQQLKFTSSSQLTSERVRPRLSNTSNRLGVTEEATITVTVTSKGQVTVPKQVRDRLGIKPGSKVDFEVAEDGRAFLRKVGKRTVKPSRFERMPGTATSGLTTDAIMALSRGESR